MGYLIFMYAIIGLYFVVFMFGTEYDYLRRQNIFINIYLTTCIWLFWPYVLYKLYKS